MKNHELYHKTVDILVQAYFNDTLVSGNCQACAVGNLVAANMGFEFAIQNNNYLLEQHKLYWKGKPNIYNENIQANNRSWFDAVNMGEVHEAQLIGEALEQIISTGYTPLQIAVIESAFEHPVNQEFLFDEGGKEYMFERLIAVIEALDIIHENTDAEVTTTSKSRFNKQLA